jgi:Kef-type K+ transport system membrane component KefB
MLPNYPWLLRWRRASPKEPAIPPISLFLLQALLVLVVPALVWHMARLRRLVPLAVVQILTGIVLGPSLLGRLLPGTLGPLIAPDALAPLSGIATLAVLLFAFVTGLHLEPGQLRGRGPGFLALGIGSTALPALLGALVGLPLAWAHPDLPGAHAGDGTFAAAVGIAAGVTALPVLGAILREMGLLERPLGRLALACAAVSDALLWLLLALLLAQVAGTQAEGGQGPVALLAGPAYALFLLVVARPLLARLAARHIGDGDPGDLGLVAACAAALGSAAITEALGLHHILGAFLAGAVTPKALRWPLLLRLETPVAVMLMPFFFVLTGLRTVIEPASASFLMAFLLTTLAATAGKLGGTALLARAAGEPWPTALALGALMQTKGLIEVVVLTILLDAGVIGPPAFSALVLMALVSTAATMPLTRLFLRRGQP